MTIKNWPEAERPREKLLRLGPQSLSDSELLAIFLRTGVQGRNVLDLSRDLIQQFGGLRGLLSAPEESFCQAPGMGRAKYTQLQATLEIGRRHLRETLDRDNALSCPEDVHRYIQSRLRDHEHEVFACLFLDNRHRVIKFEELFTGTIDGASVYPREVVKRSMTINAAAVIFAHNHPSGIAEPSGADRAITQKLIQALSLVEVRVLDHIIVGDGQMFSFAEQGWMSG